MRNTSWLFFLVFIMFQSCFSTRLSPGSEADEFELLDTLVVMASRNPSEMVREIRHSSKEKKLDLKHILLDLNIDWEKHELIGQASLTLSPFFYPQDQIVLDAKKMEINAVLIDSTAVQFDYDGLLLTIPLAKTFTRDEEIQITIKYKTKAWEKRSQAPPFKDDMGVYFIDPDPMSTNPSAQVWTQGETEYNSYWFPCVDQPNERMTQEIRLRVKDNFTTLSNGILTEQIHDVDDYRTDVWVLDIPHPVYLAAFVVGEYFVRSEMINGVLYQYYVDSSYADYAQDIYANTPEMVRFFSAITGVDFPWPKYGQVPVKHFVAGAMENTTATIYGDFIQKTPPELYDEPNDAIIAHELFHQWFGNYITCESWANLTLNEGFASYGEYLWAEHKYGTLEAEEVRYGFLMNYLFSSMYQVHPLIHYSYEDSEDMFNAHSYDKGALSLHLLRTYLGDDAFFEGIKKYIKSNALNDVEFDKLRLAFEEISGKDLLAFFDQWFSSKGHPEWNIQLSRETDSLYIDLHQDQFSDKGFRLFRCPLEVSVYNTSGDKTDYVFSVSHEQQRFIIPINSDFSVAQIDPERKILGRLSVDYSSEDTRLLYLNAKHPIARFEAFKALVSTIDADSLFRVSVLEDPYYRIRAIGIDNLERVDSSLIAQLKNLAFEDPHPLVRRAAINKMSNYSDENWLKSLAENMLKEPSQKVLLSSFKILEDQSPALAVTPALRFLFRSSFPLQESAFNVLRINKNGSFFPLMEKSMLSRHGTELNGLLKQYVLMASELGEEGRIHARNWITVQLKMTPKSSGDYKILIKYRQSLL